MFMKSTPEVQTLAFSTFCIIEAPAAFKLVATAYQLETAGVVVKPLIDDILKEGHFRRGCDLISALQLQDLFDPSVTSIPLAISKTTSSMLEPFIEKSKVHQVE